MTEHEDDSVGRGGRDKIAVITPVFDDWESLLELVRELNVELRQTGATADIFAVDDGSSQTLVDLPGTCAAIASAHRVGRVVVLRLGGNLGHQRAIAIGLAEVRRIGGYSTVVVMDADGEDRPSDVVRLMEQCRRDNVNGDVRLVVAQRSRRSEGATFTFSYSLYKRTFSLLTGARIDFGNFCAIPAVLLDRIAYSPFIWNHFSAGVLRARVPIARVPTDRGVRYAGQSKMNLISLVTHGLSAISVFIEQVLTRFLLVVLAFTTVLVLAGIGVVAIRLATDLAIPGWATTMFGFLGLALFQALTFAVLFSLIVLAMRVLPGTIPAVEFEKFIQSRHPLQRDDGR